MTHMMNKIVKELLKSRTTIDTTQISIILITIIDENNLDISLEVEESFKELLDESYPKFMNSYLPSRILPLIDDINYRTMLSYYADARIKDEEIIEIDGRYIDYKKLLRAIKDCDLKTIRKKCKK